MAEIEFYSQYGKNKPTSTKETFTKPSLTEPDNSMSIPEIIARFTRGQGIQVQQHPWTPGVAPEEYEVEVPQDATPQQVLGIESEPDSQQPEPAPQQPEPAPEA